MTTATYDTRATTQTLAPVLAAGFQAGHVVARRIAGEFVSPINRLRLLRGIRDSDPTVLALMPKPGPVDDARLLELVDPGTGAGVDLLQVREAYEAAFRTVVANEVARLAALSLCAGCANAAAVAWPRR